MEVTWEREFEACGAYWRHDGNLKRPFARLTTSDRISNSFFNGGRVADEAPHLLLAAAEKLLYRFQREHQDRLPELIFDPDAVIRVIGAEYGGIALSTIIAGKGRYKSAFAQKQPDGSLVFKRTDFQPGEHLLLIEDTVTTGRTLEKLRDAAVKASPGCQFFPHVLALCNRSGSDVWQGMPILSLIQPEFQTWEEGQNPFTRDGEEAVPPVRPKENWEALTREYA